MSKAPLAFLSYAIINDSHDAGRISELHKRLSYEVEIQTGEPFPIFQDREDIQWGQTWQERLTESVDAATFLIPVITPSFFKRPWCREELSRFLEREQQLGRNDLILPIYYVDCPFLNDSGHCPDDPLAAAIASRQRADWRELRFEPFTNPLVGKTLANMAVQIRKALERVRPAVPPAPQPMFAKPPASPPQTGEVQLAAETPRKGPSPKTEIPTVVVDPFHRGDYPTLNAAIKTAQPGTRILVRPGVYLEGIVIDKPLEIIGDGLREEIEVKATGQDAILFQTSMGRVTNLTLRQAGGGEWFGVDITQGCLMLEDCDISSQSLACVAIHDGADPRLKRNRIHDGQKNGVLVYDNGQGTLEDNEIFGNTYAGISITAGSNPTLLRNRIYDGQANGIRIDKGQGTLEDNEIFGNTLAGISITAGSNPTLRRNRIHDCQYNGALIYDEGQGILEDNEIFGNAPANIVIKTGGNPTLRRNRIYDGQLSSVWVYENGQGTLEDNEIFGNTYAGILITTGGNPTLRRNRIYDGQQTGVLVYDKGQGTLEDNEVFGNTYAGVSITTGGNPTLRRNRIYDGQQSGICVLENSQGALEENEIFGNAHFGILIKTGSSPTVSRNCINNNGGSGIYVSDGGGGTIENNDLRDNKLGTLVIADECKANVTCSGNVE
jgi:parallel beta-helix repeat protein